MGYSHNFSYEPNAPDFREAWPTILGDVERIVAEVRARGVALWYPIDPRPMFEPGTVVAVNGDPDEEEQQGVSLVLLGPDAPLFAPFTRNGRTSLSCKTGRMPYDLAVTAILLRCRLLLPDNIALHSDGEWDDEWLDGATRPAPGGTGPRRLVAELFGGIDENMPDPFDFERATAPRRL